ncbi:MAG: cbb3-type cytochrome c oxidase N-terminal domain-containing protein [Bacteroidota bacterium]
MFKFISTHVLAKRTFYIVWIGMFTPIICVAQEAEEEVVSNVIYKGIWESMNMPEKMLVVLCGLMIVGAIYAVMHLNSALMHIQKVRYLEEYAPDQLVVTDAGVQLAPKVPWWKKLKAYWVQAMPTEKEATIMLDHEYDGIRELDNRLPPWWLGIMYVTMAFAPIYIGYQHFSEYGISNREQYALEMEEAQLRIDEFLATQANAVDETNVTVLTTDDDLAMGEMIYSSNCVACHGAFGEGTIGPNLTDDYWLHGGSIADVFTTIKYGVVEKGMQAWKTNLSPHQMQQVASYIKGMRGSEPNNPKPPEGELYVEAEEETTENGEEESGIQEGNEDEATEESTEEK